MSTEKDVYLKNVQKTAIRLGEFLNEENWEEANQVSSDLSELLKAQPDDLTSGEMRKYHFEEMSSEIRKFWYFYKELRKSIGALRKKGDKFIDFANAK
ncbi:hypothetical protein AB3331_09420 [Streptococcus sp. H49]|uniref:hypothetical protein n=1 Tax=Streptococcus huangxiaojuni TaxID=3237239 RepID=UPI0034A482DF